MKREIMQESSNWSMRPRRKGIESRTEKKSASGRVFPWNSLPKNVKGQKRTVTRNPWDEGELSKNSSPEKGQTETVVCNIPEPSWFT